MRKRKLLKFNVDVVYDKSCNEFKAIMDDKVMNSELFFYVMDEVGQHGFFSECAMDAFDFVGHIITNDARHVLKVLNVLNMECNASYRIAFRNYKAYFRDREDLPF